VSEAHRDRALPARYDDGAAALDGQKYV
jgi:hypothetical protein